MDRNDDWAAGHVAHSFPTLVVGNSRRMEWRAPALSILLLFLVLAPMLGKRALMPRWMRIAFQYWKV